MLESTGDRVPNIKQGDMIWNKRPKKTKKKKERKSDISPCCQLVRDSGGFLSSEKLTEGFLFLGSEVRTWSCLEAEMEILSLF